MKTVLGKAMRAGLAIAVAWVVGCSCTTGVQAVVSQAQRRLERLEAREGGIQKLVDAAQDTKDDLVQQLRDLGVTTASGFKGNAKARSLVGLLQKTVREIESYEQDQARFTEAITQTRAMLRRLERAKTLEEAGLSDEELASLAETNLTLEEAARGPLPMQDPIQEESVLQTVLNSPPTTRPARPQRLDKAIIGSWTPTDSYANTPPVIEFTPGGKAFIPHARTGGDLVASYKVSGNKVTLTPMVRDTYYNWKQLVIEAEVLGPEEMIWTLTAKPSDTIESEIEDLLGKVRRVR